MSPNDIKIIIPAALASLPLTLSEKVVLAHIDNFRACHNAELAELIGISSRGAQNLLARLRRQGYVQQCGKGRARRLFVLLHVEQHISSADEVAAPVNMKPDTSGVEQPFDVAVVEMDSITDDDL